MTSIMIRRSLTSLIRTATSSKSINLNRQVNTQNLRLLTSNKISIVCSNCQPSIQVNPIEDSFNYSQKRSYSAKKSKGGQKIAKPKVELRKDEIDQVINYDDLLKGMKSAVEHLKQDLSENLTLRLEPSSIEQITVKTPEGNVKLGEIAQVEVKSSNSYVIDLINSPDYLKVVHEALVKSNLNLNPQTDKTSIYLQIPKVTREHRENMAKSAKLKCEQALKKIREVESKALRKAKENKKVSKDLAFNVGEHVKYQYELHVKQANDIKDAKIKEILNE